MSDKKLTSGKLLDENGALAECGYATELVKEYNRGDIKACKLRIKEWDYYLITQGDDFGVALTVDDNSYMGLVGASFLDFKNKTEKTVNIMSLLPMGKTNMPSSSQSGDVEYKNKRCHFSFRHENGERVLQAEIQDFEGGKPFKCDIALFDEPLDSMVIATPFAEKKTAFYYNQKTVGMKARGTVEYKGESYTLRDNALGLLDWGRGVWTYDNTWYWGAGQGYLDDGKLFGYNIGYGFGDTKAASENMLFYEGTAHKIGRITFNIPKNEDGKDSYLEKWTFTSDDKRFEAEFTPIIDRANCTSALVILSDQHQVFGYLDGFAVLDGGERIEFKHFLGMAEKVRNKW